MIVLGFRKISTVILESFQEEEQLKWKFQPESTKKPVNMKELSNFPSEQVFLFLISVGYALEVIPKTLATNCGMDVVRIITELRAKHTEKGNSGFGIDGNNKKISDMSEMSIWEPVAVKNQILKTAIEASCLLLRIDDVVSGVKKKEKERPQGGPGGPGMEEAMETFGDARDG